MLMIILIFLQEMNQSHKKSSDKKIDQTKFVFGKDQATPFKMKSESVNQYYEFFKGVECLNVESYSNQLKESNIQYHPNNFALNIEIQMFSESQNCKIVTLFVTIGYFTLSIKLFNEDGCSPTTTRLEQIGKGTFGTVYFYTDRYEQNIAIKNSRNFSKNNHFIFAAIKQYCISKLLSCLKIGPKISSYFGFDLIVYDDSIEFAMEMCQNTTPMMFQSAQDVLKIKSDMKLMHSLGIVHNDIKSDNIMFSKFFNKIVFIDFNCSSVIEEKIGEKTLTRFKGNIVNCSPEMKRLYFVHICDFVDLYYNDIWGLKELIQQKQIKKELNFNFQTINHIEQKRTVVEQSNLRFCQCLYLHLKLRMLICDRKAQMLKSHLLKYLPEMSITEEMRENNKKIVQLSNSEVLNAFKVFISSKFQKIEPHREIAEFNVIIQETLKILLEVPLTKQLLQIKEVLFSFFQPEDKLLRQIDRIYKKKSLVLPLNEEKVEKYRKRFDFGSEFQARSSHVKMLELVAIFICKEPKIIAKKKVSELTAAISNKQTSTLQAIEKLELIIKNYEISDEGLTTIFDVILAKQQKQQSENLQPKQKYKKIKKLHAKLLSKQKMCESERRYSSQEVDDLLRNLQNYIGVHRGLNYYDQVHVECCIKLVQILRGLLQWDRDVYAMMRELKRAAYPQDFANRQVNIHIREYVLKLHQTFLLDFPVEFSVFFRAIGNYVICMLIKNISLEKPTYFEELEQFMSEHGFSDGELKKNLIAKKIQILKAQIGGVYQQCLQQWSNQSLHMHCYLFEHQLIKKCQNADQYYLDIDWAQIIEYFPNISQNKSILYSILRNIDLYKYPQIGQLIYQQCKSCLFFKLTNFSNVKLACAFRTTFFTKFWNWNQKQIPIIFNLFKKQVKQYARNESSSYYWNVFIETYSILNKSDECYFAIADALEAYPQIQNIQDERLHIRAFVTSLKIIAKCQQVHRQHLLRFIHNFIARFANGQNIANALDCQIGLECCDHLLKIKNVQLLIKFLTSIVEKHNQSFFVGLHTFHYFFFCKQLLVKIQKIHPNLMAQFIKELQRIISHQISENAKKYLCALVYQVYQIMMTYDIFDLNYQSGMRCTFFNFVFKNIGNADLLTRRQIQVDWHHFVLKHLKGRNKKHNFSTQISNKKRERLCFNLMLKQFRQNQYRSYCDYYENICKQLFSANKYNVHETNTKILGKLEKYNHNKMLYVSNPKERSQASLNNLNFFTSEINDSDFFTWATYHSYIFHLFPLPSRNNESWSIKVTNMKMHVHRYFYRFYILELKSCFESEIRTRKRFLQFYPFQGFFVFYEDERWRQINSNKIPFQETVQLKIDRGKSRIYWSNSKQILAEFHSAKIMNPATKFDIEVHHEGLSCRFHFQIEQSEEC